jgi:small subunit ribosomal protein S6
MNSYETVFILTPVLSDDQAKEAVQKFESEITAFGAKIKHLENWGLRKLAYPIQKKSTGFYFLIEFVINFPTEFSFGISSLISANINEIIP